MRRSIPRSSLKCKYTARTATALMFRVTSQTFTLSCVHRLISKEASETSPVPPRDRSVPDCEDVWTPPNTVTPCDAPVWKLLQLGMVVTPKLGQCCGVGSDPQRYPELCERLVSRSSVSFAASLSLHWTQPILYYSVGGENRTDTGTGNQRVGKIIAQKPSPLGKL